MDLFELICRQLNGKEMPRQAKARLSLAIALVAPPANYAVLLVDSQLVTFDFRSLVMVTGASFTSA